MIKRPFDVSDDNDRAELMAMRASLQASARAIAQTHPDVEVEITSRIGGRGEFAEQLMVAFKRKAS